MSEDPGAEMADDGELESVSTWIGKMRQGDPEAIAKSWARYGCNPVLRYKGLIGFNQARHRF